MKKYSIMFALIALVLASLACQIIMGGGDDGYNAPVVPEADGGDVEIPAIPSVTTDGGGFSVGGDSEFPLPSDASNVISVAGVVNFQTDLPLDEAMKFYQDEFGKLSYNERGLLTVTSDSTFSMVFDGHESGKAIVVQGVDLGNGTTNISISLQYV